MFLHPTRVYTCMENLEGKEFKVVQDMTTAERTTDIPANEKYKVTDDPANYERVDEECLELLHESNYDLPDDTYPVKPIVRKEEFLKNTEEV